MSAAIEALERIERNVFGGHNEADLALVRDALTSGSEAVEVLGKVLHEVEMEGFDAEACGLGDLFSHARRLAANRDGVSGRPVADYEQQQKEG